MLTEYINEFSSKYESNITKKFGANNVSKIITNDIPFELVQKLRLDRQEYSIKGSVGQGAWAEIPWVAIMHRGIANSTQDGYYIVFLFSKNRREFYVTLGLGWTQFKEKYGAKTGLSKIVSHGYSLSKKLNLEDDDITEMIDLNASNVLGRGYEAGNICSRKFIVGNFTNLELDSVLERYLGFYWQLIDEVGADIFFDDNDIEFDFIKDTSVKEIESKIKKLSSSNTKADALLEIKSLSDTLPPKKKEYIARRTIRNRAFAEYVKQRAEYICEVCCKKPFYKKDGGLYAEADHVAPLVNFGVDHPDNMRCLCAQCHRVITYGSHEEIAKLSANH